MTAQERQELIEYLEAHQLVAERSKPLAPARLSAGTRAGLWALRVFAIVLAAMVIYTFVAQLG